MNAIVMRVALVICVTTLYMSDFAIPNDIERRDVRWSYKGSSDMPDGIAFDDYVDTVSQMLGQSREEAVDFVIFSLELPDDVASRTDSERLVDIFQQASAQIKSNKLALNIANYCPGGMEARTNTQIFAVMDQLDDEYLDIYAASYLSTLAQLAPDMAARLQTTVEDHKEGITIVSLDHKKAWEAVEGSGNPDMRAKVSDICESLIAERDGQ